MRFNAATKLAFVALSFGGIAASAQTVGDERSLPNVGLNLPSSITPTVRSGPRIHKATAIVNGYVITATDVEQRIALVVLAAGGNVPDAEREKLRPQILSSLIDEALQIQEAKVNDIVVSPNEIGQAFARIAEGFKRSPAQLTDFLRQSGSSERSLKRQLEGDIAWNRLLRRRVEPTVNVSDDEVKSVMERLNASKGATEYRVAEIYLSATPENQNEVLTNANRIVQQLRTGGSFANMARQFSESTSAGVGGDLGFLRAGQLPGELGEAVQTMQVGQIAGPIPVSGGYSILYLVDTKKILVADPRDTVLSLRQVSINFPKTMKAAEAQARAQNFVEAVKVMQGCGGAEAVAKQFGGDVVDNDRVVVRDLPGPLQDALLGLQVGQATAPFGSQDDGVRVIIVCGRDEPQAAEGPNADAIENQLRDDRMNRRAQVYLRDLRRDAVIDYR
ncbi:MAG: hypothetical protein RIS52_2552 [Pseudomonadota bacterium]|jgi:peptidyl-prolyl cis-trans isomerase SurA